MIIEFFGVPGAGKSFYSNLLKSTYPLKYNLVLKKEFSNLKFRKLKKIISKSPQLSKSLRLYDAVSYEVLNKNSEYQRDLLQLNQEFFRTLDIKKEIITDLPLIMRSLERDIVFSKHVKKLGLSMVNDDGIAQRLISIYGLREHTLDFKSETFINLILNFFEKDFKFVYLDSKSEIGINKLRTNRDDYSLNFNSVDFTQIITNTISFANYFYNRLLSNNIPVLKINNQDKVEDNLQSMLQFVK